MNKARIIRPPQTIDRGLYLQYANREILENRFLTNKIAKEVKRQRDIIRENNNNLEEVIKKTGGQVAYTAKKAIRIWTNRRRSGYAYYIEPSDIVNELPEVIIFQNQQPSFSDLIKRKDYSFPALVLGYDNVDCTSYDKSFLFINQTDATRIINYYGYKITNYLGNRWLGPSISSVTEFETATNNVFANGYSIGEPLINRDRLIFYAEGGDWGGTATDSSFACTIESNQRLLETQATLEFFAYFPVGGAYIANASRVEIDDIFIYSYISNAEISFRLDVTGNNTSFYAPSNPFQGPDFSFIATKTTEKTVQLPTRDSFTGIYSEFPFGLMETTSQWRYSAGFHYFPYKHSKISLNAPLIPAKEKVHIALVEDNLTYRLYIDGTLVHEEQALHPGMQGFSSFRVGNTATKLTLDNGWEYSAIEGGRVLISQIRYTSGEALYFGASFNPPASITDFF